MWRTHRDIVRTFRYIDDPCHPRPELPDPVSVDDSIVDVVGVAGGTILWVEESAAVV